MHALNCATIIESRPFSWQDRVSEPVPMYGHCAQVPAEKLKPGDYLLLGKPWTEGNHIARVKSVTETFFDFDIDYVYTHNVVIEYDRVVPKPNAEDGEQHLVTYETVLLGNENTTYSLIELGAIDDPA